MPFLLHATPHTPIAPFPDALCLLLGGGSLGSFFPVTPHHDHADKRAHYRGPEEDEEDGDANGPDARREESVEDVVVVDEGLGAHVSGAVQVHEN